jgi:hypothetical protein
MTWDVKSDSTVIVPLNNQKFNMYSNSVDLDGTLILHKDRMKGMGTLEWNKTQLVSDNISFYDRSFDAKNGNLNLTNENGVSLLKIEDVNASLDLDNKIVNVELNRNDTLPLEAFKYIANPKFLTFDLNKNTTQLKSRTPSTTFFLQSTDPSKELLTFETSKADLDLNNNTIFFGGIKELKLADSKVLPDKNEIYIEADGSVRKLQNAVVVFNADSSFHKIQKATINVLSRNKFGGTGVYEYKSLDGLVQNVKIDKIDVNAEFTKEIMVGDGRNKTPKTVTDEDKVFTYAKAELFDHDKFRLNKNVFYKGTFDFDSKHREIDLNGSVKIVLKAVETDWIKFRQKLDPQHPEVSIDSILAQATYLVNGLLFDRITSELYTSILQEKRSPSDAAILNVKGNMSYDKDNPNAIIFGNDIAFTKPMNKATAMKYDEVTKKLTATGQIDLNLNLGEIKAVAVGDFEYNNDQNLVLNADLAIGTYINDIPANYIINSFIDADSSFIYTSYRRNNTIQRTIANLCYDSTESKYAVGAIYMRDSLYKPESMPYNLILSGTKFFWDAQDVSFKSVGTINLPFFGSDIVKRPYTAYVEIGFGGSSDYINILLTNKTKQWLYIRIRKGQMGITSSLPDIFQYLVGLPDMERTTRNGRSLIFELLPADMVLKEDFISKMESFKERFKSQLAPPAPTPKKK